MITREIGEKNVKIIYSMYLWSWTSLLYHPENCIKTPHKRKCVSGARREMRHPLHIMNSCEDYPTSEWRPNHKLSACCLHTFVEQSCGWNRRYTRAITLDIILMAQNKNERSKKAIFIFLTYGNTLHFL